MTRTSERACAEAIDWRPSAAEISRYRRDGWSITPPILQQDDLDSAWSSIEAYLNGSADHEMPAVADATDRRSSNGEPVDHLGYLCLRLDAVRRLVLRSGLARIAGLFSGAEGIRLFHDRLIIKPSFSEDAAAVGWHTDRAYWRACTSGRMLTAWIPFSDVDRDMGALSVIPGSHRWRGMWHTTTAHRTDMERLLDEIAGRRPRSAIPIELRRGQISFHHCRTLHGSAANRSGRLRAALAVHLQPTDNRHRDVYAPSGRRFGHTNDLLCRSTYRGHPDYADDAIFPLLWRRADEP